MRVECASSAGITAHARIRWLLVSARNSSFTYRGQASDVKRFGRELGVRYVLKGSMRKGGHRVRIVSGDKPQCPGSGRDPTERDRLCPPGRRGRGDDPGVVANAAS